MKKYKHSYSIIYEDEHLIAVNKAAGLLAVPIPDSRAINALELVAEYLAPKKQKAMIVHRIDRYTSGIILFAKKYEARQNLIEQFLAHSPTRIYLALVRGHIHPDSGELRHCVKLTKQGFRQVVVQKKLANTKMAVLEYNCLEYLRDASLLKLVS